MKKKNSRTTLHSLAVWALLLTVMSESREMSICAAEAAGAGTNSQGVAIELIAEPESRTGTGRQDGERFEETILLEGMEETVRYEHVINDTLGFEMDYDYEGLVRHSEPDRECFVSAYDNPEDPFNYLEVSYSPEDAENIAAFTAEALPEECEISREELVLEGPGRCILITASSTGGSPEIPDQIEMVYIIPAADGCRVAAAHCTIESLEGFGTRFREMLNTLVVTSGHADERLSGIWQTASMGYEYYGTVQPEYYVRFTASEIVYGHLKDRIFAADHSADIVRAEETAAGGLKVQAETAGGAQFTYCTREEDSDGLDYFGTWREEDFAETYSGSASLSRVN